MKRAIKTHSVDFAAIIVLLLLAVLVSGYVLSHERLQLPFIGTSQYHLNMEFSTGQAVTPGQGQTVRVSGVQIGDIGSVTPKNGVAIVQMDIDTKYRHSIHTDATGLLRPKTGLKDMFIELNPGSKSAPVAPEGYTFPASATNPDVNPDEILASLDGDTRQYLDLLINGAGQGLKGQGGSELAKVLERFLPTHQSLAQLNRVVAERGSNLRRLIHSLRVLNSAMATKKVQITQLIDAANKVFHAFANANQGVSQAVAELPATLRQTTSTLLKVKTFADLLTPTTRNLAQVTYHFPGTTCCKAPAIEEITPANNATIALARPAAPILQNQIRPFVVAARPLVRSLKPASTRLATATPNLSKTFVVLNHLFNMLGYSPGGGQHGYLWWLAWGDHNARTVFSTQDANGDYRQLFLQASCDSLAQVAQGIPGSEAVLAVTGILTNAKLCPTQAAANQAAFSKWRGGQGAHISLTGKGTLASPSDISHLFYPKLPTH
jgi:phospholipid/cholesterol/gamma-HCH transport system substrate-binding protein